MPEAIGQPDPTNTSPVNFQVVFSESVTGFTDAAEAMDAYLQPTPSAQEQAQRDAGS